METSEMKEKVVESSKVVSSTLVGASCDETRSSMRAREWSRKSCFRAISRSGICALKEKNSGCGVSRRLSFCSGSAAKDLHLGACHEAVGWGVPQAASSSTELGPMVKTLRSLTSLQSSNSASGAPVRNMQRAIWSCRVPERPHAEFMVLALF